MNAITIDGTVVTTPRHLVTSEGLPITTFRMFHRTPLIEGRPLMETQFFTVTSFRQLATNASLSIEKGDRVLVTGRLRIRDWENAGNHSTNVEIEASHICHDLNHGASFFRPNASLVPTETEETT